MATSLQAQLAQIAAKSTNPLDLKAQRKAHSQSLLYEPKDAGSQDFHTIYQIGIDGFESLCSLDSRFTKFARSLFSDQSKDQDRTQMTADQNTELDAIIESFLSLVGGFLQLTPALQAVEWLVRRFRIHEQNVQSVVLTFLPYHAQPAFTRLLSILPKELPTELRFLTPFRESGQSPPRQSIVSAAVKSLPFFNSLNQYMIACTRRNHQHTALVEFWTSTVSESVVGQVDSAMSGRMEARLNKEQDVLLRLLPVLNEGLSMKSSGMREGCYAILTVLVSKMQLADTTIAAMMESVIAGRETHIGDVEILCLAILARHQRTRGLPKAVFKRLMKLPDLSDKLQALANKYDGDALILSLFHEIVKHFPTSATPTGLGLVETIVKNNMLDRENVRLAIKELLRASEGLEGDENFTGTREQVMQMLLRLENTSNVGELVRSEMRGVKSDERILSTEDDTDLMQVDEDDHTADSERESKSSFADGLKSLQLHTNEQSFLRGQSMPSLSPLFDVCVRAGSSSERWGQIRSKAFGNQSPNEEVLFFTLLVRLWCGPFSHVLRRQALAIARELVHARSQSAKVDLQFFIPYTLIALADDSSSVRRAAADLLVAMNRCYSDSALPLITFGAEIGIYSDHRETDTSLYMKHEDAASVMSLLVQHLEECCLDSSYLTNLLRASLNDGKLGNTPLKSLKDHVKESVLTTLTAHVSQTPIISVQMGLLRLLRGTSKIKGKSKSNLLLPFLNKVCSSDTEQLRINCEWERVRSEDYIQEAVTVVSASSKAGLRLLTSFIEGSIDASPLVRNVAIKHIGAIWSSMKLESRQRAASVFFLSLWRNDDQHTAAAIAVAAADILGSVDLDSDTLCMFLDSLPSLYQDGNVNENPAKRQKTETGHFDRKASDHDPASIAALQQWAFVLELVERGRERGSFDLISKLSTLLNDLYVCIADVGGQVHYVLSLLLDCCNAAVREIAQNKVHVNPNIIPVEAVIDIFQNTSNSQVQRASLLYISTLSQVFPDVIIHHIMPVFTKMGQSVLQQADEYSVRISDQAIQSIVPPLLESFEKQKGGIREGIVRLLLSFAAAFDHIPQERRLPLFQSLLQQLGSANSLHLLLLLLVNKFGKSATVEDFVVELFARYSSVEQLAAIDSAVRLASDAIDEYPSPFSAKVLQAGDVKSRIATVTHVITMLTRILSESNLARAAAHELDSDGDKLRRSYSQLSEAGLRLSSLARPHKKLLIACNELTESTLSLLPIHESIAGLESLLSGGEDTLIRQTLNSIEKRVGTIGTGDVVSQSACVNLLAKLAELLDSKADQRLLQVGVACVDSIIERFGKKEHTKSLAALEVISSRKFLSSVDEQTVEISILCIATAAQVLGEGVVSLIPKVVPLILDAMKAAKEKAVDGVILNAAYTLFAAILDGMSWAMSKKDIESLLRLSAEVASEPTVTESTRDSRTSTLELLAKRIEPRDCLSALASTWNDAIHACKSIANGGPVGHNEALLQQLQVSRVIINTSSKSTVVRNSSNLMAFFTTVFEFPAQCLNGQIDPVPYSAAEVEEVIVSAAENLVAMVYKLNDASFRPLFSIMIEWASRAATSDASLRISHNYSLFIFLARFFGTLKSIVTSYAGMIVEDISELLTRDMSELLTTDKERSYEHSMWCRIMETLRHGLDNDADEYFQAPSRFTPLCKALVSQLTHIELLTKRLPIPLQDDDAREVIEGHLVPTIVSLANAADAAENAKALNKEILLAMRSHRMEVRIAAIHCQQLLVEKIGEDWLANLPEMLPVVGDVLEDEDDDVVSEARKWVRAIEGVLGESLEGMLQ